MKRILFIMLAFGTVLTGCSSDSEDATKTEVSTSSETSTGDVGSSLTYKEFTITLNDAYYADFPHDEIELNFDKYLAADFSILNSSDEPAVAKTLNNFTVVDDNENLSRVMIDENKKKFSSSLMAGDVFDITLVFPIKSAEEYTINYSYGVTSSNEDVLSWTFNAPKTRAREVEETIEHRNVEDVVKTFLFGDGSKQIEFDADPKSDESEVSSEDSEASSEVANESNSEVSSDE